jgi:hypothetical protein
MTLNLQRTTSELAEKIAALLERYPHVGAAQKNVYLFTPTEAERDLIVKHCTHSISPGAKPSLWDSPMPTSNRSVSRP